MNILEMNKMQLEEYYNEHMQYNRAFDSEKKAVIKRHTAKELEYMFKTLYSVNRAYKSKEMNFDEIQRYFDNLHRAKTLSYGMN